MGFSVEGQTFRSAPVSAVGSVQPAAIVKDDSVERLDYCPLCELEFGMRIRPSGNPRAEGRVMIVGGHTEYVLCHIHSRWSGKLEKLPTKTPA